MSGSVDGNLWLVTGQAPWCVLFCPQCTPAVLPLRSTAQQHPTYDWAVLLQCKRCNTTWHVCRLCNMQRKAIRSQQSMYWHHIRLGSIQKGKNIGPKGVKSLLRKWMMCIMNMLIMLLFIHVLILNKLFLLRFSMGYTIWVTSTGSIMVDWEQSSLVSCSIYGSVEMCSKILTKHINASEFSYFGEWNIMGLAQSTRAGFTSYFAIVSYPSHWWGIYQASYGTTIIIWFEMLICIRQGCNHT